MKVNIITSVKEDLLQESCIRFIHSLNCLFPTFVVYNSRTHVQNVKWI